MALSTINFKITFNVSNHTIVITDTTDYAGQSVSLSDAGGTILLTDPMGNVYSSSITPSSSLNSSNISPVLDSNSDFILGLYSVNYSVLQTSTSTTVSLDKNFNFSYISPTVSIAMTFDPITPLLTSTDETVYTFSGIQPSITRVHTLIYPPSSAHSDYVVSTALLETSTAYTAKGSGLQHTSHIESSLSYQIASDYFITDSIEGYEYINVFADNNLCEVYCCIASSWQRYQNARCESKAKADVELKKLYEITMNANLMRSAMLCGKYDDINKYYNEILRVGECSGDCGCDDGEPILVTGLGGGSSSGSSNIYYVVSSNAAISIAQNTAGLSTTYTLTFSPTLYSKLVQLRNVFLLPGNGIDISSSTDANGNKYYTIDLDTTGLLTSTSINRIIANVGASFEIGTVPVLTVGAQNKLGNYFDASGNMVAELVNVTSGWDTATVITDLTEYHAQPFIIRLKNIKTTNLDLDQLKILVSPVLVEQSEYVSSTIFFHAFKHPQVEDHLFILCRDFNFIHPAGYYMNNLFLNITLSILIEK